MVAPRSGRVRYMDTDQSNGTWSSGLDLCQGYTGPANRPDIPKRPVGEVSPPALCRIFYSEASRENKASRRAPYAPRTAQIAYKSPSALIFDLPFTRMQSVPLIDRIRPLLQFRQPENPGPPK